MTSTILHLVAARQRHVDLLSVALRTDQQTRGTMMDTIKYSARAVRDDVLMQECGEIAVTIEGKRVFVSPAIIGDDTFAKLQQSVADVADRALAGEAFEIDLPAEFAAANGMPLPASETGTSAVTDKPGQSPAPATDQSVSSTSDARTVNNVMRHEYRVLTDIEKARMKELKDAGADFLGMLDDIAKDTAGGRGSRELSLARTKMEEAVMWSVKHITA